MACTSSGQNTVTNTGSTRAIVINVVDCDGAAVDVSDYNITYTVMIDPQAEPVITKTTADGISVAVDEITVLLDVADTALSGGYFHKLVIDDGSIFHTALTGRHRFGRRDVSSCDALEAVFDAVVFDYGPRLDFSKASNSQYLSLVM